MKKKFFRNYFERNRAISNSGTPFQDDYAYEIDKETGVKSLVKVGETDFQALIDANRDSTDIQKMVERFVAGDQTALNSMEGLFIDATQMPSNYAELVDRVQKAEEAFSKLPADIKSAFNNSPTEFWQSYGSPEFNSIIDSLRPVVDDIEPIIDDIDDKFVEEDGKE